MDLEKKSRLLWLGVFIGLIGLECLPVWTLHHFPSQDGPSHLYNAAVLADWSSQPVYRQYYDFHVTAAGNLLPQLALAGLLRVAPEALIEKTLLTAYFVLFALAFLALLREVSPYARTFSLFAFIFAASNFFHVGFWNFIFSIPLALLTLRYYLRGRERPTPRWYAGLTLAGLAVYETHMASWMMLALSIGILAVAGLLSLPRKNAPAAAAIRALAPLLTLLPAAMLTIFFAAGGGYRSVVTEELPETLVSRISPLAALSFLRSLSDADLFFAGAFGALVAVMAVAAAARRWRSGALSFRPGDIWLLLALAAAAVSVLAPSEASGVLIRHRFAIYAWIYLVIWLATQSWSGAALRRCAAGACLLAALPFFWRIPEERRWDRILDEFTTAGPAIRPASTVLALDMDENWRRINPMLHAVDLFASRRIVDLRNYEASLAYFPTQFREGRNPFGNLGTLPELEHMPPIFHLAAYEQQTGNHVDYLLFYGPLAHVQPELRLYRGVLRQYRLVFVSQPRGLARLYQRIR